jgi:MATE family multidrug resistance protein
LVFIGQLNDPVLLSAVGIGNVVLNSIGTSFIFGLNSGLETLVSQAFGAKNFKLCGIYLQRGRIALIILMVPIFFI